MAKREPRRLSRGKAFHKKVQADWERNAQGQIESERTIIKPGGRGGRIDIFVHDDGDGLVAVAEIKASDWDKMTDAAVRRNVRRQVKQIWDYIDSQLSEKRQVSPGVIFQKRPKDRERMMLIEQMFEDEGIPVVWEDESVEQRKGRA